MEYKILVVDDKKWLKDLNQLNAKQVLVVKEKIELLRKKPWPQELNVKKLNHYPYAEYRVRVGDYRILFDRNNEKDTVELLRVKHRSQLY